MKKAIIILLTCLCAEVGATDDVITVKLDSVTNTSWLEEACDLMCGTQGVNTACCPAEQFELTIEPCNRPLEMETFAATSLTNTIQVDFFARLRNRGTNTVELFEEVNGGGYNQLKIVCSTGWREYWLVKQPPARWRGLPHSVRVRPGASLRIPVAFNETLWDGVNKVKADAGVSSIRVVYDQICTPTNDPPYMTMNHWNGIVTSPYYDISKILPRQGFKSRQQETLSILNNVPADVGTNAPNLQH